MACRASCVACAKQNNLLDHRFWTKDAVPDAPAALIDRMREQSTINPDSVTADRIYGKLCRGLGRDIPQQAEDTAEGAPFYDERK